ncbi:N-acetylmuramoyl-L-alanine amidase [Brucella intermedia]|nr:MULTISPECIES: N-acetylmuramoyl-L-alanine amidase [Brucella]MCH6203943.1 N-acetylmuramoyl-L-alanine amidase [Brucella ciceri]MCO7738026.1 N-acetylmuramoyl-L-alanine amidase [Brucella intermedia]WLF97764.1 N-acetylmuramoyl-L-alanine amidase [Brucella intermedia]
MAGDDLRTRIVVMFDREPKLSTLLLDNPHRLVVDLPETRFGFDEKSMEPRGLVSRVRYGLVGKGRSRLILTLRGPFKVEDLRVLKNESASGYRLVADIVATSDREFADQLQGRKEITSSTDRDEKPVQAASQNGTARPFTIMIDPGHGGIDSGAESLSGIKEKDLTLAFGQELRDRLAQDKNIKVLMTREDDTFLRLSERVRIARQHEADLFISIHADTITQHDIRGATVYTISDKASDSVARAMAERENKSDTLAGAAPEEQPEVTDILLDLTRRETHTFSLSFAEKVIHSLQGQVNLINNPHRFAGFQVLRAPDVPSVLIEIGYLSNAEDEKLISNPEWRKKLADRLAIAIKAFEALKHPASLSKG